MSESYKVKFWKIKRNASSKKPSYVVRWTVDGEPFSTTLGGKELAENYLSDLRQAAKNGEWFDTETGLPQSMLKAKNSRTWLALARAYMEAHWPHLAPNSRKNTSETLVAVTLVLTADRRGRPDTAVLRRVLRRNVFLPEERRPKPDAQAAVALRWLEAASLPVNELKQARHVRAALDALALRLDGTKAALSTVRRKRAAFHHALEYAVELEELDANPLDRIKRKPTKSSNVVDRRVVVNPRQARELLIAVTYVGRTRGPRMAAMFACMYYAALRPAEAQGLREQDCYLPETGGGFSPSGRPARRAAASSPTPDRFSRSAASNSARTTKTARCRSRPNWSRSCATTSRPSARLRTDGCSTRAVAALTPPIVIRRCGGRPANWRSPLGRWSPRWRGALTT
ncbi:hypothetical protein [Nonomuraea sp. SYSU D8015]|uniref:hypothetical protein n=1 Tax=Nonomuraea sp. SYSU D8015 TaxID=2593644 RepID=UPI001CB74695|nr:hypothetical protein [Nonomuraea sp. SYSU D8015]